MTYQPYTPPAGTWHPIVIDGYRVVAQALLSRGAMTAPRSTFVAVPAQEMDRGPILVAEWNHQTGSWFNTEYGAEDLGTAYYYFGKRLDRDRILYLSKGVPLTVEGEA